MSDAPDAPYRIVFSGVQTARARALGDTAAGRGLLPDFLAALRLALERLAADPLEWGDPYADLRFLGLQLHHRSCPPLNVFYAVDPLRRIVYIKDIDPLPGGGLDAAE